ncbi:MAG: aldo/keto reductase, partial [Roseobacter sp.]
AQNLGKVAAEIECDPATLAVAWAAAHHTSPMPIISARSVEQLIPSLAAMTFEMTDEIYAKVTALSPTPPPATDRIEEQL